MNPQITQSQVTRSIPLLFNLVSFIGSCLIVLFLAGFPAMAMCTFGDGLTGPLPDLKHCAVPGFSTIIVVTSLVLLFVPILLGVSGLGPYVPALLLIGAMFLYVVFVFIRRKDIRPQLIKRFGRILLWTTIVLFVLAVAVELL